MHYYTLENTGVWVFSGILPFTGFRLTAKRARVSTVISSPAGIEMQVFFQEINLM
jgi:hypothetical protein